LDTNRELAIVIPCKNEENFIGGLLNSLANQSYDLSQAQIVIADAASTDRTRDRILQFKLTHSSLTVDVIPGGMPSVGRNRGAAFSKSRYILFIDADIELRDRNLIQNALQFMQRKGLHCATTGIRSQGEDILSASMYGISNLAQKLSRFSKPFSTGMFMLFDRIEFERLGGFDENVHFAEDYYLSMKVAPRKFYVIPGHVYTTNRRFQRSGYLRVAKLFLTTAINSRRQDYFYSDHKYWRGKY
jgi:glycosyltransferase involved in cell wall biosynthesis